MKVSGSDIAQYTDGARVNGMRGESAFASLANDPSNTPKAKGQSDLPRSLRNAGHDPFEPPEVSDKTVSDIRPLPAGVACQSGYGRPRGQRYGNVAVPQSLVADYAAARGYMAATPRGRAYLSRFESPDAPATRLQRLNHTDPRDNDAPHVACFDSEERVIYWNPREATVTTTGGIQSPANTLAHEIGHAVRAADSNGDSFHQARAMPRYTNEEEYNVITKLENELALTHNEGLRDGHNSAGQVFTHHALSTLPSSAEARHILRNALPELRLCTDVLENADLYQSFFHRRFSVRQLEKQRDYVADALRKKLDDIMERDTKAGKAPPSE